MEVSQDLQIKGYRREVPDCSVFRSNQVLEFLWSAKWGHGGREWQSHYLKMLLGPGGLQTKLGNVKRNESFKIILCNPFILAYSIHSSEATERPGLVWDIKDMTASKSEGFCLEHRVGRIRREMCEHVITPLVSGAISEWNEPRVLTKVDRQEGFDQQSLSQEVRVLSWFLPSAKSLSGDESFVLVFTVWYRGQSLRREPRLALNSWSSGLSLLSIGLWEVCFELGAGTVQR